MASVDRRLMLAGTAGAAAALWAGGPRARGEGAGPTTPLSPTAEPMAAGPFTPAWDSLGRYEVPEWYRDAKFGIWAHWGPQCQPEQGDWYARFMYFQGTPQYDFHVKTYGHPTEAGFKEVIRAWQAEHWNPDELVAFYKEAGAKYFFAMASHHDNLDLWASKHQPWNATRVGPQQDLVGRWAAAARREGLPLGVSVHASHAWSWQEQSRGADKTGPLAGRPYDGRLTKANGAGTWWEGLDPHDLYACRHPFSKNSAQVEGIHSQWHWDNGCSVPDAAYCEKFYNRTLDLINQHRPELLYFDDSVLPLWGASDVGLKIAAHYYNQSVARSGDKSVQAVLFAKRLDEAQRRALTWDVERGASDRLEPLPWQTDTCLGHWHYDRSVYDNRGYKSPATVVRMLCDIVSKNGNLLLNVPVRGDGTIDDQERAIVREVGGWLARQGDAIYGTRPWKKLGEGPSLAEARPLDGPGFNEGKGKPFSAQDIRFTTKEGALYAIALGKPSERTAVAALGRGAGLVDGEIERVELVGHDEPVAWRREEQALVIDPPQTGGDELATAYRVTVRK